MTGQIPKDIKEKGSETLKEFCYLLIDGLFFCVWAAINFCVNIGVSKYFPSEGPDVVTGYVLQVLFAFATLSTVLINTYKDLSIMWIRANKAVAKSRGRSQERA